MDRSTVEEARSLGIQTLIFPAGVALALAYIGESAVAIVITLMIGGQSTLQSLLALQPLCDEVELLASGGVRHPWI